MKKNSTLRQDGEGLGQLKLYTLPDFQGDEVNLTDTITKYNESPWKGKKIGSLVIKGNPWMFYTEDLMKVNTPLSLDP